MVNHRQFLRMIGGRWEERERTEQSTMLYETNHLHHPNSWDRMSYQQNTVLSQGLIEIKANWFNVWFAVHYFNLSYNLLNIVESLKFTVIYFKLETVAI